MGHDFVNLTQTLCFLIKYMQVQLFGLYNIDDWQGYDVYIYRYRDRDRVFLQLIRRTLQVNRDLSIPVLVYLAQDSNSCCSVTLKRKKAWKIFLAAVSSLLRMGCCTCRTC